MAWECGVDRGRSQISKPVIKLQCDRSSNEELQGMLGHQFLEVGELEGLLMDMILGLSCKRIT